MSPETLIAAGVGWWVIWALKPWLVPALDRFWKNLLKDMEF